MKFAHSLLFNAVPDWTNHYLAYDALKAQIYKFEKQAVLQQAATGPATSYRDEPSDLEAGAAAGPVDKIKKENEKTFIKLLDKELHKITEFYVAKERELLGDLVLLQEDLDRLGEDEEADFDASDEEGSSPRSDSEEDLGEEERSGDEDEDSEERKKGTFARLLNDPREYSEAARAGRKTARQRRQNPDTSGSRSRTVAGGGAGKASKRRARALSSASETGDLLGLEEEREDANGQLTTGDDVTDDASPAVRRPPLATLGSDPAAVPSSPTKARRSSMSKGARRALSQIMGGTFLTEEESPAQGAGWDGLSDWAIDTRIMFKRRLAALFTSLSELKQYVDLNYTGLSKVLKKYDKITNSSLREHYMKTVVDHTFPFERSTQQRLQQGVQSIVPLYADLATGGDIDLALKQLKAHLREHVVWERNTVWREMIGLERRGWGTVGRARHNGSDADIGGNGVDLPLVQPASPPTGLLEGKRRRSRYGLPSWINSQTLAGAIAIMLFLFILSGSWFDRIEEQNCLALLAVVIIFWALEIMPLFVTALMVPFLVVVLRVLRSTDGEDRRLTSPEATKYIFSQMFSPTIMLLLGGFTLAAALSKQNIDKVLATKVLSLAGTKPRSVLFAYMLVACFASMWISNVAAPVLCYSLIQPILRTLPSRSAFPKALILGIALASNIGGLASPISSPQNLIALEYMNPPISWLGWFSISIPVSFTCVVLIWCILLWTYRSGNNVAINPVRVNKEPFNKKQWFVSIVTIATIILWCVESKLEGVFGDMGIIAILPIVAFYGSGILRKADFDHSPWSIVFLAMGGIALGKAVLSSGLLDDIDALIQRVVLGLDIWPILALFSVLVLVIGTFISHTIAAVLVVPIASTIGNAMDSPHPRLLILATAMICSAGMGLPVSGFPVSLRMINQEDELGQRYLDPSDFYKVGILASVVTAAVIITLGYIIMRAIGL
ncbi:SPX-domain-containing protein [Rhodotorula sp. JG-1b]|nr:SPX-domain-containing protein [Rhodotorula sp. JG-1b]